MLTFGAKLRGVRNLKGLKQSDLAELAGIPRQYVIQFEKEDTLPAPQTKIAIEKALGVSFDHPITIPVKGSLKCVAPNTSKPLYETTKLVEAA